MILRDWPGEPDYHATAVPKLEAVKAIFEFRKQMMSRFSRLFVRKAKKLFDGRDMSASHEKALHG
jgi:hypothetical protein